MLDIRLARIDDRLIHGQVAISWTKETNVDRILVVSDTVAKDEMRKLLLQQAAPPGVKATVITLRKLVEISNDQRFDGVKAMLLFTETEDVEQVVRAGVPITTINIGGMKFSNGKKMITNFVSVNEADIYAFRYLHSLGIELEIRKVPADKKIDLMELLEKKKMI